MVKFKSIPPYLPVSFKRSLLQGLNILSQEMIPMFIESNASHLDQSWSKSDVNTGPVSVVFYFSHDLIGESFRHDREPEDIRTRLCE